MTWSYWGHGEVVKNLKTPEDPLIVFQALQKKSLQVVISAVRKRHSEEMTFKLRL